MPSLCKTVACVDLIKNAQGSSGSPVRLPCAELRENPHARPYILFIYCLCLSSKIVALLICRSELFSSNTSLRLPSPPWTLIACSSPPKFPEGRAPVSAQFIVHFISISDYTVNSSHFSHTVPTQINRGSGKDVKVGLAKKVFFFFFINATPLKRLILFVTLLHILKLTETYDVK